MKQRLGLSKGRTHAYDLKRDRTSAAQTDRTHQLFGKLISCTWRLKPLSDSEHTNKTLDSLSVSPRRWTWNAIAPEFHSEGFFCARCEETEVLRLRPDSYRIQLNATGI